MREEQLILIGSDVTENLTMLMNSLKASSFNNIISVYRMTDLFDIAGSMAPGLIISCFRNNQELLNKFSSFSKMPAIPILCIDTRTGIERLQWSKDAIIFTYLLENIKQAEQFNSTINSIFLLGSGSEKKQAATSFAEAAIQQGQAYNNRNMSRMVLELDQKMDILSKVKERITNLFSKVDDPVRTELTHIVNAIKNSVTNEKLWEDFKLYFVETNPGFLFKLAKKYPALTQHDLKYCCYLKMNMTNDDIRALLGINQESVRTHKYRLKKKLALGQEQSLRTFLQSVN